MQSLGMPWDSPRGAGGNVRGLPTEDATPATDKHSEDEGKGTMLDALVHVANIQPTH